MEQIKKRFEFDTKIMGMEPMEYMARLLELNEEQKIDLERCKAQIGILKQMNNRSKELIDAVRVELKEREIQAVES